MKTATPLPFSAKKWLHGPKADSETESNFAEKKEILIQDWQPCSKVPVILSKFSSVNFNLLFFYGGKCVLG